MVSSARNPLVVCHHRKPQGTPARCNIEHEQSSTGLYVMTRGNLVMHAATSRSPSELDSGADLCCANAIERMIDPPIATFDNPCAGVKGVTYVAPRCERCNNHRFVATLGGDLQLGLSRRANPNCFQQSLNYEIRSYSVN